MKKIVWVSCFLFLCHWTIGQTCNLTFEDFTGTSTSNPPPGWELSGIFIGQTVPADPIQDPAANVNRVDEYLISPLYDCVGEICFDWHASSMTSEYTVQVSVSQDSVNWTTLQTIQTTGVNSPTDYQNVCVPIPSGILLPPFQAQVRWEMIQRDRGTFYVENICISDQSCMAVPTELRFFDHDMLCDQINTNFNFDVCATDSVGIISDTFQGQITIVKQSGPGSLNGQTTYFAVNGCANIDSAYFTQAGDYVLAAMSNSLSGESDTMNVVVACPEKINLNVMSYNLLNFSDVSNGCSGTHVSDRWDTLQKIVNYVAPDIFMVCELETEGGADSILINSLNHQGNSNFARAEFILNQSGLSNNLNNMFFYDSDKVTLYAQTEIITTTRDINKYTVFVNDTLLAQTEDTLFIDFFMTHLKAGNDMDDVERRETDCQLFKNHIDSLPSGNYIFGGDFNLYTSTEPAYQLLLGGINPLNDPIDTPGDWNTNSAFAITHTQSTRTSTSLDCGALGGCDSRFDFLLISDEIEQGTDRLVYEGDSYFALGNNGSIYNDNVNDPWNTANVPDSVLNALFYMSDHLPVVMELKATLSVETCPDHLTLSNNELEAGYYGANQSIQASGLILPMEDVILRAGSCIELDSIFEVSFGATLDASPGGCD